MSCPRFAPIAWFFSLWLLLLSVSAFSATINVNSTDDSVASLSDGLCSLREAVRAANFDTLADGCTAGSGADVIQLPDGSHVLQQGELGISGATLASDITIRGNTSDPSLVTIDANSLSRHFKVYAGNKLSLQDISLTQGFMTGVDGGSILVETSAELNFLGPTIFSNNGTDQYGGAIANSGITSTSAAAVLDFNSNYGGLGGGAIVNDGILILSNSNFTNNRSDSAGGALYLAADANISNSTFTSNSVTSFDSAYGGAIYVDDIALTLSSVSFDANAAAIDSASTASLTFVKGGAIALTGASQATLNNVTFNKNQATNSLLTPGVDEALGGAIFSEGRLNISTSSFIDNTSGGDGGAIALSASSLLSRITDTSFTGNIALLRGGAISNDASSLEVFRSLLTTNNSQSLPTAIPGSGGGAIHNDTGAQLTILNSTISSNSSPSNGAGIYNAGQLSLSFSTVALNTINGTFLTVNGGGIFNVSPGVANIGNSLFSGNTDSSGFSDAFGNFNSQGFNLLSNSAGATGFSSTNNDILDQDPLLLSLADNGGPTQTHALDPNSPAIDAATTAVAANIPASDQRGGTYVRPVDGNADAIAGADIGAYEYVPELSVLINGVAETSGTGVIDMGTTAQGTPVDSSFVIYNPGSTAISLSNFVVPAHFALTSTPPTSLAAGASVTVPVRFLADALGSFSGVLSFDHTGVGTSPFTLTLAATASEPVDINVSFQGNNVPVGGTVNAGVTTPNVPLSAALTISNPSATVDLSISAPMGLSAEWTLVNFPTAPIPPGGSADLTLEFNASSIGSYSSNLSIPNNSATKSPFNLILSTEVVDPPTLQASVDSIILSTGSSVDFGQTTLNMPINKVLLLENAGDLDLQVSAISLPTGFSSDFVGPQILSPGAAFNVALTLSAQSAGTVSGTMSIASNDPNLPQLDVLLSGEVIPPGALQASVDSVFVSSGSSLNFGQTVLNTPVSKTLLLENTGSQDIQLESLSMPTGFISAFPTPPYILTPGSSLSVELQLEALSAGVFSGTMTLLSDAPNLPQLDVSVTGEVVDNPGFDLIHNGVAVNDGAHIDFGQTTVGQRITKYFLVTNTGGETLNLDVSSLPDASFSLEDSFPMSIAPGVQTSFSLSLMAETEGSFNSSLLLVSNDPEKTSLGFSFSGSVSAIPDPLPQLLENGAAVNSGASIDFGDTPVGSSVSKTFTLVNNGNAVLQMADADPGEGFDLVGAFPISLSPGESSQFDIVLTAQTVGSYASNLVLTTNSSAIPAYQLSLSGTVSEQPTTELVAQDPGQGQTLATGSLLDFGSASVGELLTLGVNFSNVGSTVINITGISLSGDFVQLNSPQSSLAPGESTVLVMELPTESVGFYSGTLVIDYVEAGNSTAQPQSMRFNLTGEVDEVETGPEYMPVEITLSQQTVGNTAAIGSNIGQFSTYEMLIDPDTNTAINSELVQGSDYHYSLVSGEGDTNNSMFNVSSSGLLSTAADFSDLADVSFSIRVHSENTEGYSREQSFNIFVEADNLPPEQVILSPAFIEEGRPAGTFIGSLSTIDPNAGDTHSYQITGGANGGDLLLSGNVLMSARAFEYAVEPALEVTITARDQFNASISQTFSISVQQQSIRVQALSTGWRHSCALLGDGSLNCWGWNNFSQSTPPASSGFRQVSLGSNHSCATRLDGSINCWGSIDAGQGKSPSGNDFASVSAGGNHNCALRDNQRIYCWGYNFEGQLNAPDEAGFIQVSAGGFHTCAIHQDGRLLCWGANNYGQSNVPEGAYTQVSAGEYHTCAVTDTRAVRCWGDDYRGQVSQTPGSGVFQSVSSGEVHNCGLLESGEAICWGDNTYGQASPPFDNQFTQISAGGVHTCGVRVGNSVVCWGDNNDGQAAPPVAALNRAPENLQLSISSLPHLPVAGTLLGTFSAQDSDTHDSLSYQLVSGEGDQDNNLFIIKGATLSTATALTEVRTYSLRVEVSDGNQGSLVQIFALGME